MAFNPFNRATRAETPDYLAAEQQRYAAEARSKALRQKMIGNTLGAAKGAYNLYSEETGETPIGDFIGGLGEEPPLEGDPLQEGQMPMQSAEQVPFIQDMENEMAVQGEMDSLTGADPMGNLDQAVMDSTGTAEADALRQMGEMGAVDAVGAAEGAEGAMAAVDAVEGVGDVAGAADAAGAAGGSSGVALAAAVASGDQEAIARELLKYQMMAAGGPVGMAAGIGMSLLGV